MRIHSYTTGTVSLTPSWQAGNGAYPLRLLRALSDRRQTEPLPIWCYLIEHPEGLILIDTGIPHDANRPVWFPPHMRLVQRAAPFTIASEADEIGPQLMADGFHPEDVRWVILTHLHQDHEGGLHHFPNATFLVSETEWQAATGLPGRLAGYLNHRWPSTFAPQQVTFDEPDPIFSGRTTLTDRGDIWLVPTPGHSAGHLSVIMDRGDHTVFFAGDASYSEDALLAGTLDGVGPDGAAMQQTHAHIRAFATEHPTIYLPSHEWAAPDRLQARQPIPVSQRELAHT